MSDSAFVVSGDVRIKTELGYEKYEAAIAYSSTAVETQRGLVPLRQLRPDDEVILKVKAGSMPGLIPVHG